MKTLHGNAFKEADIQELHYNTNATHTASGIAESTFYQARVNALTIGEGVTEIPDYVFSRTYITQDTLNLDVRRIGKCAFYYDTMVTDLTIGEGVRDIGDYSYITGDATFHAVFEKREAFTGRTRR